MTSHTKKAKGLSKRQVSIMFGFNLKHIDTLVRQGVLVLLPGGSPLRREVDPLSLGSLVEGEHFVVCKECGSRQAALGDRHTRYCSGMTLAEYVVKHGNHTLSEDTKKRKVKTELQKLTQSECLKARFQTPEGEKTRQEIGAASRKSLSDPEVLRKRVSQLVSIGADPTRAKARSVKMWANTKRRENWAQWCVNNRDQLLGRLTQARLKINKTSKLHLNFKKVLESVGVFSTTEHPFGYYSIDEAVIPKKVAIEVDGCFWHGCAKCGFKGTKRQKHIDSSKDAYLKKHGWVVVRIAEHDLNRDAVSCAYRVKGVVDGIR